MKHKLINAIGLISLVLSSSLCAQPLPQESPEYKQLEAIGYDINSNDKNWTVASLDSKKIAFQKQPDRIVMVRYFSRKKGINQKQELELYRIINKITIDYLFQIGLGDDYIAFAIYLYGPYDAKTFAKLVRYMENAQAVLEENPAIFKIIN